MSGGSRFVITSSLIDDFLDAVRATGTSYMMSSIACSRMARRPRAPALRVERLAARRRASAPFVNLSFTPSISNSFWNCFTSAFFGLVRMSISASSLSSWSVAMHRQAADELGDEAELEQVLGLHLLEQLAELVVLLAT